MKIYELNLPEISSFGIKRFYFDGIIEHQCPCGGMLRRDFSENYISYPEIGKDINIYLICDTCKKYYNFQGRIEKMTITLSLDLESMKED